MNWRVELKVKVSATKRGNVVLRCIQSRLRKEGEAKKRRKEREKRNIEQCNISPVEGKSLRGGGNEEHITSIRLHLSSPEPLPQR